MSVYPNFSDYQIAEQLYAGTRTLVYRGIRTHDQQPVVIKLLRNEYPNFTELLQFRNQYTLAKNLNFPSIIQVLNLEKYRNSYALIMEDFGGVSLSEYLKIVTDESQKFLPVAEFLNIGIQLTDILHYLYQNRVIHKDIKPANILIHPETKQVKLIDFSISSLLPRETQQIQNANALEGTLAYLSPEQTGRMNRGIDYRSDFYSLGITFYELLAGELPFVSADPMEIVHCHLAKHPIPIHQINLEVPLALSEIASKLMAKNAENRYQTALGIKHDLEICLSQLQTKGKIESFEIGKRDISDRFIIPEKLYGRETEVNQLLAAFERVSTGNTEIMLVAGFSGIGKTAVVNEVHKPIVRQRGYFIKGKYDQFQRNIPFSAFVQAFRDLMGQLLSESDQQLQAWKNQILAAVGDNGQVLIDVIPELENIIDKQPPATELSGTAAQNRFNLLFQKFLQVFTSKEHPLVMFLDDWQWADSASLNLLKLLLQDTGYLLILGAYRDNEVSPAHPFILTVDEIVKTGATANTITLPPLKELDLNCLVADTLNCELSLAKPLTKLVYQKTKGNPFFATQFLKALHDDKLISFDWKIQHWQCDIAQVKALAITEDVVEFMVLQLQKLPTQTQDMLKLAACIGAEFDLNTLVIVSEQSAGKTATALWKALQEGLIIPTTRIYKLFTQSDREEVFQASANPTYRFLHDRVQQAAYSLIPDEQKQTTHYRIGELLLLHHISPEKQEENIFEIVNHLNRGSELIVTQKQRNQLAELNLVAGEKALSATAYAAASKYFEIGIKSLDSNSWQSQYRLTLSLYEAAIKAEYLNINFSRSQTLANFVLERVTNVLDRVKLYEIQIQMYMAQSEMPKALAVGILALELLGVDLNHAPASSAIALPKLLAIESLPVMQDANQIAVMRILMAIFSPAYTTRPELLSPIVLTMIDLSLKQGHTSLSAFAYVFYGIFLCGFEKDLDRGYYSGLLALKVLDRFSARELECKVNNLFNVFIRPWKDSLIDSIEPLVRASEIGFEMGDIEYASYATAHRCTYQFLAGETLTEVQDKQNIAIEVLRTIKQDHSLGNAQVWQQLVSNLLGDVTNPRQFVGNHFDETELLPIFCAGNDRSLPFTAYLAKCILSYLFGDYSAAVTSAVNAANYADAAIGITVAIHNFYYSLALLSESLDLSALKDSRTLAANTNYQSLLDQVEINQKFLKVWAVHAPKNFAHKYSLVAAEQCRVLGQKAEASDLYDRAITGSQQNEYIQEEALANELAAKFYLDWGKEKFAALYMQQAYYCYAKWGAKAKIADLETRYPQLLAPILQQTEFSLFTQETISDLRYATITSSRTSSNSVSVALDLATILKAYRAISGEIELDKLLLSLLSIIIKNAGADKCVLMLMRNSRLLINGSMTLGTEPVVLQKLPVEDSQDIPLKLIYKVQHDLQTAVLIDAIADVTLANDPYIIRQQPYSILCSPILYQGKLMGILYLENNLTAGAFTRDRVELLNLLCAQAAISLENARFYEQSQTYSQQLERSLDELSAAQSRFHNLVDNVPGVVYQYCMTPDGVISLRYISADCYKLLEITPDRAIANSLFLDDMVHPDDVSNYQESVTQAKNQGLSWQWEGRILTPSGIVKWIHGESRIQELADGSVVWDGLLLDISDRKRMEAERQQKSQALEKALQELQNTQLQLIQGEKMSALGNLVAGVAHEINNPVGFLGGNIQPALDYINDLFELIELYQQKQPDADIEEKIYTIDLDYIREDLPKLVGSMREGVKRIADISTSLRTFSRADTDRSIPCNIHDGIDSTIMILKHRLKANENRPEIKVVKDYGNLPPIECYAGQLNQVFMNLLTNAIDAVEDSNQGRNYAEIANQITVKTELSADQKQAIIRIKDNGIGMSTEVQSQIFEHLFTTKGVGKGTGLGLAIAQQIVEEKHGGKITVNSVPNQGTVFEITIPVILME